LRRRIFPAALFIFICTAFLTNQAAGQYAYITLSTIPYEGAPFQISKPMIRNSDDSGFRVYCDLTNTCKAGITGIENQGPELLQYKVPTSIAPGAAASFFWDEPGYGRDRPISGTVVPYLVELSDGTYWSLRDYYAVGGESESEKFVYPDVGLVTAAVDNFGIFNAGTLHGIQHGQRLGVIRKAGGSFGKIAQIRTIKNFSTRSGYTADYLYQGQNIQPGDRVQLLFPGMRRLHSTSKTLLITAGLSLASAGVFHLQKEDASDNAADAATEQDRTHYLADKDRYNSRRDAALLTAGITAGSALLSELVFGRPGGHLYPREWGRFRPSQWNTTTRSFMTMGAVSLGSAFFYKVRKDYAEERLAQVTDPGRIADYERLYNSSRRKRDLSFVLAGTALSSGILNQLFVGNGWAYPGEKHSRFAISTWNPVSRSFLLFGSSALSTGFVIQQIKTNALEDADGAITDAERIEFENDAARYRKWRDSAVIIGGSALAAGVLHELFCRPDPDDIYKGTSRLAFPSLPKATKYMLGFSVVSSSAAAYFQIKHNMYKSRLEDAVDEADIEHWQGKIDNVKSNKSHMLIAAGISTVSTILSYLIERNDMNGDPIILRTRPSRSRDYSVKPAYDPLTNTAGLTIKF